MSRQDRFCTKFNCNPFINCENNFLKTQDAGEVRGPLTLGPKSNVANYVFWKPAPAPATVRFVQQTNRVVITEHCHGSGRSLKLCLHQLVVFSSFYHASLSAEIMSQAQI